MKYLLSIICCFTIVGNLKAQYIYPQIGPVYIKGQIVNAKKEMVMLANQNTGPNSPIQVVFTDSIGRFEMTANIPFQDYYFLRFQNGQILNLILFGSDSITIYSDSRDALRFSSIINSPHSVVMNEFLKQFYDFKAFEDSLKNVLKADATKQLQVNMAYQPVAEKFFGYRNAFINTYISSPSIIVTLNSIDQDKEWDLYKAVIEALNESFYTSPSVLNAVKHLENLIEKRALTKFLEPGNYAKEIEMTDPEGKIRRLSDLRGKIVLIDFWASWCAPCRRENPNVVAMYKKYNASGFEVFSVSLDKATDKEKWKAAIQNDGLIWPNHVSDLNYFQCKAALDYGVTSIPFTVLVDKEGKIIATNLRDESLRNKLAQIFGF